jgi:N-acetyl-anhydromuramyl-L-alanine amidase AmpD
MVVVHFAAGYTENQCWEVLRDRGISVHYCIDRDGKVVQYVEETNRTWHAGYGKWGGHAWLNNHALGFEIVNFGYGEGEFDDSIPSPHYVFRWKNEDDPELLIGDTEYYRDETYKVNGQDKTTRVITRQPMLAFPDHREDYQTRLWATYPELQLRSTTKLIWRWMKKYDIIPENIVGHEHVTPHRKNDPGPGFPWRKLERRLHKKMLRKAPHLLDPNYKKPERIKAVQSHCARMAMPVGDIDGFWGPKTKSAVEMIIEKHGDTYNLGDLTVDSDHCYEIANAFRLITGEDPGRI